VKCFDAHLQMGDHIAAQPPLERMGADGIVPYLRRQALRGAFLTPYGSVPYLDGFEQIRAAQRKAPEQIFPIAQIAGSAHKRPEAVARIIDQLHIQYAASSVYGLKVVLPAEQPSDEILRWCAERALPIIWEMTTPADLEWLERNVLSVHSSPAILAHFGPNPGTPQYYARAVDLLARYPQVYVETSTVFFHHFILTALRAAPERVLFGSAGPAVAPRAARRAIETLPCGRGLRKRLLWDNAACLVDAIRQHRLRELASGQPRRRPIPVTPEETRDLGFVVMPPEQFPPDEDESAKQWWSQRPVAGFYWDYQPWVDVIQDYVAAVRPTRVMEFGCNVGRNLHYLREAFPHLELLGVDVNAAAVEHGRSEFGLDLHVGDERLFQRFDAGRFDLIFTLSVLDHIPSIRSLCREMLRCSQRHVLCIEVALPLEGKVCKHFDHRTQRIMDTTPYSYSWDYARVFSELGTAGVDVRTAYLHETSLHPYYKAFLAHKRSA